MTTTTTTTTFDHTNNTTKITIDQTGRTTSITIDHKNNTTTTTTIDHTNSSTTAPTIDHTNSTTTAAAVTTTTDKKKTVWLLGVDHTNDTEFHHVVAVFDSAEKGLEYLKSFELGDIEKTDDDTYTLSFSMEEAISNGLFKSYYTKWGDDEYDLVLVRRVLNKQFRSEHNE